VVGYHIFTGFKLLERALLSRYSPHQISVSTLFLSLILLLNLQIFRFKCFKKSAITKYFIICKTRN